MRFCTTEMPEPVCVYTRAYKYARGVYTCLQGIRVHVYTGVYKSVHTNEMSWTEAYERHHNTAISDCKSATGCTFTDDMKEDHMQDDQPVDISSRHMVA